MSDNKKSNVQPTPEQLKQLQKLQQMMMSQQAGNPQIAPGGDPNAPAATQPKPKLLSRLAPKNLFIAWLQSMQNCVRFIDQLINFIIKKDSVKSNDVLNNARAPILFGTYVALLFLVFGVIWAGTAPLDSAAVAQGTVVSDSQRKSINHQEGGIIRNIYIALGDVVKAGDKLIELDDRNIKSKYISILNQYRTHLAAESRLLAEINSEDTITYPDFILKDQSSPEVAKIIKTQNNFFNSKNQLGIAIKASSDQAIEQLHSQIKGFEAQKIYILKALKAVQNRLKATQELNKKGFANKMQLLQHETDEANQQSELAKLDTQIAGAKQGITKTEFDLINQDSTRTERTLVDLKQTQIQLSNAEEEYLALKDRLHRSVIRSPVDGVINNLNFHTIGSTLPPNQTILEISPSNDRLVIDAKIEPKHIDSIRIGLVCRIRFSAFKSRTSPTFDGTIISLSPDVVIDPQRSMQPGDPLAGGYYSARIELDMEEFNKIAEQKNLTLNPGMQAEVQIITGTRTLVRYLLDPVLDAMFKGLKEK